MHSRHATAYVFQRVDGRWHVVVPIAGKLASQTLEAPHSTRAAAQAWLDGDEGRACVARIGGVSKPIGVSSGLLNRTRSRVLVAPDETAIGKRPATVLQALDRNAALWPDKVAVRFVGARGEEEASVTYAELRLRVEAAAADMVACGLQGSRVVFARHTSIPSLVELLGAMRAGATAVPVDPRLLLRNSSILEGLLRICAPAVLAVDGREAATVRAVVRRGHAARGSASQLGLSDAGGAAGRPRPAAVHLGIDFGSEGRHDHARQPHGER